jgi:hypothetical protein
MSFQLTQLQALDHFLPRVSRQEKGGGIEGCMWLNSYCRFFYLSSRPLGRTGPGHT